MSCVQALVYRLLAACSPQGLVVCGFMEPPGRIELPLSHYESGVRP